MGCAITCFEVVIPLPENINLPNNQNFQKKSKPIFLKPFPQKYTNGDLNTWEQIVCPPLQPFLSPARPNRLTHFGSRIYCVLQIWQYSNKYGVLRSCHSNSLASSGNTNVCVSVLSCPVSYLSNSQLFAIWEDYPCL